MKFRVLAAVLVALSLAGCIRRAGAPHPSAPAGPSEGSTAVSSETEVRGEAQNHKVGAALATDRGVVYIDGLDSWPDAVHRKTVVAKGRLVERHDLPVFVQREGEPIRAGIPVPEGTDVEAASKRQVLEKATWALAP